MFKNGTPNSLSLAITNALSDAKDENLPINETIEMHILEYLRNCLSIAATSGDFKTIKYAQKIIERRSRFAASDAA